MAFIMVTLSSDNLKGTSLTDVTWRIKLCLKGFLFDICCRASHMTLNINASTSPWNLRCINSADMRQPFRKQIPTMLKHQSYAISIPDQIKDTIPFRES